jgi:predicted ArsR family transcriptional regulator
MTSNGSPKLKPDQLPLLLPKKVFVDVFTDNQQKFLNKRIDHTRGYLTAFRNDDRKKIAHRFLDKIEQAISDAYEEALAEDAELRSQYKRFKK